MNYKNSFIEDVIKKAQKEPKRILYPEGNDERILEAASIVSSEGIANPIILGNEEEITNYYKSKNLPYENIQIINPSKSQDMPHFVELFYMLRKHKGISIEKAKEIVKDYNYFGTLMVYEGKADGMISGACHSTADTVRPALQIIKTAKNTSIVSSMFFMCFTNKTYVFADCGLVENPNAEQLADIAIQSSLTAMQFGIQPVCAMLSYSTMGSAEGNLVQKVKDAASIAKEKIENLYSDKKIILDGEIQADAAIVPSVAQKKCPNSNIKGNANVLIFPDLNSGNIAYKLVQRLCGASAFGPILQGLKKPVNDLSRGCSVDDIIGVTAITVVQCQNKP